MIRIAWLRRYVHMCLVRPAETARGKPLFSLRLAAYPEGMGLSRSEVMARIRGRDTMPELILRRLLWRVGLRYRLHGTTPAGRPDIIFPKAQVAVFVDGCFWHGCPDHYVRPRSSNEFWSGKLVENFRRDATQTKRLEALGWRVCRIWEHEILEAPDRVVQRVRSALFRLRWRPPVSWKVVKVVETDPQLDRERRYLRDLRDSRRRRTVTQRRSTRKWRRV